MFRIRQYIKMLLQNVCLPMLYHFWARRPVQKGKILMADAHHTMMPFSMRRMYETLKEEGKEPELFVADFGTLGFGAMLRFLVRFMRAYATAEYVFICDYFLPAASCKKRPETTLVQLWHSCGLMKKIAFDTGEDIPKNYRGNMFGNYSYLTMSAQVCVPVHAHALRIPQERIVATGISRTDYYFDPKLECALPRTVLCAASGGGRKKDCCMGADLPWECGTAVSYRAFGHSKGGGCTRR